MVQQSDAGSHVAGDFSTAELGTAVMLKGPTGSGKTEAVAVPAIAARRR